MNEITDQNRKQLRKLMEDPAWIGFEAFFRVFMEKNFVISSVKRSNEFDTLWYLAEAEGGKRFLHTFVKEMEEEVNKLNQ